MYICQSQPPNSSHPLLAPLGVHKFVLQICVSISVLQKISSIFPTYALTYSICFPLCDILNSEWQALDYSRLYKWPRSTHFYDWIVFHCINVLHLLYPFICWWSSRLFPCPSVVNSAVVNTGLHVCFELWFSQGICSVVLLGHIVLLF